MGDAVYSICAMAEKDAYLDEQISMVKLPVITIKCPHCGIETETVLAGLESQIYFVCECGRVVLFVVVKGGNHGTV